MRGQHSVSVPSSSGILLRLLSPKSRSSPRKRVVSVPSSSGILLRPARRPVKVRVRGPAVSVPSSSGILLRRGRSVGPLGWAKARMFQSPLHRGSFCDLPDRLLAAALQPTFQSPLHRGSFCDLGMTRASRPEFVFRFQSPLHRGSFCDSITTAVFTIIGSVGFSPLFIGDPSATKLDNPHWHRGWKPTVSVPSSSGILLRPLAMLRLGNHFRTNV